MKRIVLLWVMTRALDCLILFSLKLKRKNVAFSIQLDQHFTMDNDD